jgi:lipoprotein-releasing system permease protein
MFFLSWRQLSARKMQSLLILLGISLGTLLFVTISGLQLGLRQYIADSLLNNTAHVLISGSERMIESDEVSEAFYGETSLVQWILPPFGKRQETRLENYQGWHERLSRDPDVLDFSPRLVTNAILTNGTFTATVGLIGVVPERQLRISSIEQYMTSGSFSALSGGGNTVIIGSGVAKDIGARINQYINISSGRDTPRPFKIVGITHFGNEQADRSTAFAELTHVQAITKTPGRVSQIAVALYDIENSAAKAAEWKLGSSDKVEDWQEANKMFMEMFKVQDYTRYFITTAVLVVAAFGIYNVLSIMINQKRREIAILRALGYGPEKILRLILYQGILLGVGGGIVGILLGFLACLLISSVDIGIEIGGSNSLLVSYHWSIYVTAFVSANFASLLASYLPARAASRMTPMDIIRADA